uniref:Band 7 domain-containing protein n=1 Tax=Chromera velia CCMP2878 TaxID=1169474 RepID=A0A0G4I3S8_9ALVE|eukprot:Cvel_10743.t1-p1 / transcript=Cvel_10743.t1 / gene=Cvel_10743 / organism=Chromera_velia_CCMP2878 / gene_product=Hypersensitive-induced response protein 2, putative / transcript_product=Hypersensitive-induced response protein 2, putative / location=Cvel_scaffold655:22711-26280(+) / protein_length=277 / sequence_SO=supercontig / SO=protein_coding / is_pseudo=false
MIMERCGKFNGEASAGLNCFPLMFCGVDRVAGALSLRVDSLEVMVESKTKDNVFVQVVVAVQYHVMQDRTFDAFYKLQSSQEQIRSYIFDVVRATVPKMMLDEVFESKEEIATAVKTELKKSMDDFGYSIIKTLVTDIQPDMRVRDAMNEINASKRQRIAAQEKAEADKLLTVKRAEGEAETKFLQGQGIARQRKAIVDGLRESVQDFSTAVGGMNAKEVLDLVLITQYFDTLKDLGNQSGQQTIFIPHNPGSLAALADEIRSGVISQSKDRTVVKA